MKVTKETKYFFITNCIVTAILICFLPVYLWVVQEPFIRNLIIHCLILSLISLAIYLKTQKTWVSANILCFITFYVLIAGGFVSDGINGPGVVWFAVAIAMAGFVLSLKAIWFWGILYVLGTTFLYFAPHLGWSITNKLGSEETFKFLRFLHTSASVVVMSLFSVSYIRHRNLMAERLKASNESLKAKIQENSLLLRVVAHDLINPLTVAQGLLSLELPKHPQSDNLQSINRALKSIGEIIDHTRSYAVGVLETRTVSLEPISLAEIQEHIRFYFEPKMSEKKLDFLFEVINTTLEACVFVEREIFLHEVVNNLMTNAIKFSEVGGRITVRYECMENRCKISICDTGIGIPPSIRSRLFMVSETKQRRGTQGEKGTGLGLIIAHSYIEKFGGHLSVESKTREEDANATGTQMTIDLKMCKSRVNNDTAPHRTP